MASTRRVKNVAYDDYEDGDGWDEEEDWGNEDWGEQGAWTGGGGEQQWTDAEWKAWENAQGGGGSTKNAPAPGASKTKTAAAAKSKASSASSTAPKAKAAQITTASSTGQAGNKKHPGADKSAGTSTSGKNTKPSSAGAPPAASSDKAPKPAGTSTPVKLPVARPADDLSSGCTSKDAKGVSSSPRSNQKTTPSTSANITSTANNNLLPAEENFFNLPEATSDEGIIRHDADDSFSPANQNSTKMVTPSMTKDPLSVVVVGHVDAGKSTLMGHLLVQVGAVTASQMHKLERDAKATGKESFKYAWVLDEGEEERARGVTVEMCAKHFETDHFHVTILDAPGHKEFVPTMLQSAALADVGVLVVDIRDFDAGFHRGGQTKEHAQLLRVCGVQAVIVVFNKMDLVKWSRTSYDSKKTQVTEYLKTLGFKDHAIHCVPLSGFQGKNILTTPSELKNAAEWMSVSCSSAGDEQTDALDRNTAAKNKEKTFSPAPRSPKKGENAGALLKAENKNMATTGATAELNAGGTTTVAMPTLVQMIDACGVALKAQGMNSATSSSNKQDHKTSNKSTSTSTPLRFSVTDAFPSGGNTIVSGKIAKGTLKAGDTVLVLPAAEPAKVKSIVACGTMNTQLAPEGFYIDTLTLQIDSIYLRAGSVLVENSHKFASPKNEDQEKMKPGTITAGRVVEDREADARLHEHLREREEEKATSSSTPSASQLRAASSIKATLSIFDSDVIIVKGQQFSCYLGTQFANCSLQKILSVRNHAEKKPKCLSEGMVAEVLLKTDRELLFEPGISLFERVVLRAQGVSVAAGRVSGGR
ncbi:unnamed protein product [Amoebophrya sp. A120]|nr:unnamed protein product [Amoebophrya sp. A120]|eukprot:GSA120T00010852001.1